MSRSLAQRLLLVVCMAALTPTSVLAQGAPVYGIGADAGSVLPPLWQPDPVRTPPARLAAPSGLAPLVSSSLPEDAAWEGFVTPANRGTSSTFVEFQGKLVLRSSGVAGSRLTAGLVTWDGTKFEARGSKRRAASRV